MKLVTNAIGIVLIITGIYCFINMKAAFISLALILGIVMMTYGISETVTWFTRRKKSALSGWILGEGILTTMIGALVVFYPFKADLILAIWFAAWLISSGVMRIVGAIETKKHYKGSPWGAMMIMGIISLVAGIYGLVNPMVAGMTIAMLLGLFFIIQGINCLIYGIQIPGMKEK